RRVDRVLPPLLVDVGRAVRDEAFLPAGVAGLPRLHVLDDSVRDLVQALPPPRLGSYGLPPLVRVLAPELIEPCRKSRSLLRNIFFLFLLLLLLLASKGLGRGFQGAWLCHLFR